MTEVAMRGNVADDNSEVGILTHQGVNVAEFEGNLANNNGDKQIWRDAKLTSRDR
jgi:hypothetical protein